MARVELAEEVAHPGREVAPATIDLTRFHERSTWLPIVTFVVSFGGWVALVAAGLLVGGTAFRAVSAVPLTLAAGQLFMIGHDAAHGSHSPSRRANGVIGRMALLPSLHVFGLWRAHHDIHHRYTNLVGRDFVWAPLTPDAYRALPRWRQWRHRLYRHESGAGLGVHYLLEIWLPRMLWPRRDHHLAHRRSLVADVAILAAMLAGGALLGVLLVDAARPERVGDPMFWVSAVVFLVLVPLAATHWMIGWVIYLNHTHPDIVWYDDPAEWSRRDVQLEGSAGVVVRGVRHIVWPRRIMNHTAHHVDPGVPLRLLGEAQRDLRAAAGDRVVAYRWSVGEFRSILARCKLYDFRARSWVGYDAAGRPPR